MTDTKFTPGPWVTFDSNNAGTGISTEAGASFATAWSSGGVPLLEFPHAANARLIAAAPDLYEALMRCLNFIENNESEFGETLDSGDCARSAIAKARGEAS
jgi:hypothetical protein